MMDLNKKILLVISLVAIAFLVYSPHFLYSLPYHLDEWDHIGRSIRVQEQGLSYFKTHTPVEIGFDVIILIISWFLSLLKTDIIYAYKFLPAINALTIACILFFFLKKEFGSYWLALSALPFLAFLKSNVNILGIWFYVPILAGVPLIYLSLFTLEKAVKENHPKKIYLIAIFLFILSFIHQSSFLLTSIVSAIYLARHYRFVIENKKLFSPFLILIIPSVIMFIFLTSGLSDLPSFFKAFTWGPIHPQINYNPFTLYGIPASIFAFIGFYISLKNKKIFTFRIYSLISLISILLFPLINVSFFSAYQRYLYHFMIASIPLSALGLYISVKWLKNRLEEAEFSSVSKKAILISLIFILIAGMSFNYFSLHPQTRLYKAIEAHEIPFIEKLSEYPSGVVLSSLNQGITIRPITKKHDPALTSLDFKKKDELDKFYSSDCSIKEEYLYNGNVFPEKTKFNKELGKNIEKIDYIISDDSINCEFVSLIDSQNNKNIYKTILEKEILFKIPKETIFKGETLIEITPKETSSKNFNLTFSIQPEKNNLTSPFMRASKGDGFKTGWSVHLNENRIELIWGNGTKTSKLITNKRISSEEYSEITITYNESFRIYINGQLESERKSEYEYNLSIEKFRIGKISEDKEDFKGKIKNIILREIPALSEEMDNKI